MITYHRLTNLSWVPPFIVAHTEVIGTCVDCHNNAVTLGKSVNHIPADDICDVCHSTIAWIPALP